MGVACLEFRGENFRGWLKNREIRENFLPRKFPAYTVFLKCKTSPSYLKAVKSCKVHALSM